MSIVYDYSTLPRDDPIVSLIERFLEINVRELRPEVAAIVGEFPISGSYLLLRPVSVTQSNVRHTRSGETSAVVPRSKLCEGRNNAEITRSKSCGRSIRICEDEHGRYLLLVALSIIY